MKSRAIPGACRQRQAGSVLLLVLVALILMLLGAMYTMRGNLTDTGSTDAFSQKQKAYQASDYATQWIMSQISAIGSVQPLEISGASQPWYLPANPVNSVIPDASYWNTCINSPDATHVCDQITLPSTVPGQAWVFVEPTGRVDPYACSTQGLTAVFYDIWIHTISARGQTSADVESVYKLCILGGATT